MQDLFQNNIASIANLTPLSNSILNTNIQQVGDFDLYSAVKKVLSMTNCNMDNFDSNEHVAASIGKRPTEQLFFQKSFWNYQLLLLQELKGVNTIEDRVLLNQFNDSKTWFEYFAHNVLDLVQLYDLPIRHGW